MNRPKTSTVMLNDGRELDLCWLEPADKNLFLEFARNLREEDIRYLSQDLRDPEAVMVWLACLDGNRFMILAALDPAGGGRMAGYVYLRRGAFAAQHRGLVESFVHPDYKDLGLGSVLLREMAAKADGMGLMLLETELWVEDRELVSSYKRLGYEMKAILEDYRMNGSRETYDVIILIKKLRFIPSKEFLYRY